MIDWRDDGGMSLLEVLIAVVILGLIFVAALTSLATSTRAADVHRKQADAHAVLVSAAERLKSVTEVGYHNNCDGDFSTYVTAIRQVPLPASPGWTSSNITIPSAGDSKVGTNAGVMYWNGITYVGDDTSQAGIQNCNDQTADANGIFIFREQLVTITVTSPDGLVKESLAVVKRGT